jgi:hypothetical protein
MMRIKFQISPRKETGATMKQILEATLAKKKTTPNTVVYTNEEVTFYLPNKFISGNAPEKIILTVKEAA